MARKGSADKSVLHTRINDETWIWENYDPGEKIGQGTFGKVFKVRHKETDQYWAIKVINKEKAGGHAIKLIEREVAILKRVCHENIISLNEVFETAKKMYLVMELCEGGELADSVKERGLISEEECKVIMTRLASACAYLHKNDIVHRDLKLENILLSQNPKNPEDKLHIKVTDFGLSVVKGGVGHDNMMQDFCGTPIYMSPEIIDNKTYSQQCDVWALGVIMYIMISGSPPFKSKDEDTLYELIKRAELDFSEDVWKDVSESAKNCVQGLLKSDPAHRLTASELLHHPWITGKQSDSQPTNVLEMMKMFRNEQEQEGQNSAINGQLADLNVEDSPEESQSTSKEKSKGDVPRKGSGGTKKPGSGGKSGSSSKTNNLTVGTNKSTPVSSSRTSNTVGARSPAPTKIQSNSKATNSSRTTTVTSRGRGTRK